MKWTTLERFGGVERVLRQTSWLLIFLNVAPHAAAQPARPGDCCKGRAFGLNILGRPSRMQGIGDSAIKITTKSAEAQAYFNQGLNLLHCFWDFEAYRAFQEAARLDSSCPMAYWGMYQALPNQKRFERERNDLLQAAVELSKHASDYEQGFIRAFEKRHTGKGEADRAFRLEMEALIDRYPQDVQARLFLALFLMRGYDGNGRPKEGQVYCQALLAQILSDHPDCAAAHHYWIHAMEPSSRPEVALPSAKKIPALAPNSGHIVHMPGHVYYRIGDYDKAREAFLASMQVDEAYMKAEKVHPVDCWNYLHNLDYLVVTCAECGRYQEGLKWAKKLGQIPADPKRAKDDEDNANIYLGKLSQVRLDLRFANWGAASQRLAALVALPGTAGASAKGHLGALGSYFQGLLAFTKGMDASKKGQVERAKDAADSVEALLWQMSKDPDRAEETETLYGPILEVAALELRGCILSQQGEHESAIARLQEAVQKEKQLMYGDPPYYVRPVQESLAEAYSRAGKWEQACDAYSQVLRARPNSGHALNGMARCYAQAGKKQEARAACEKFLQAWQRADKDLAQVRQARELADRLRTPERLAPQ